MGTSEVAKNTVKAAEEGVNLIYKHYGNDLSKYFHGALKWLRNAHKGSIPAAERLEVPKQISKVRLGIQNMTMHSLKMQRLEKQFLK